MSKHAALLGIQYLVPVEMVELGASAAKHQSHGGGLQPCEKQDGLGGPLSLGQPWQRHLQASLLGWSNPYHGYSASRGKWGFTQILHT